ncbi:hypothetical protein F5Y18DRAFT_359162 [Xylariaceae sp. FL1019]|nr:hypothetical protein F5Y18DRAFT_359162 [Xylariaceae sp. FL1019]
MRELQLPFNTRVLKDDFDEKQTIQKFGQDATAQLPASHRAKGDDIIVPQADSDFLGDELLVKRLNAVQDWLWICGRPMPPRPLHHQVVISRDITITENPELHLVWSNNRIFLKPLPSWIFDPDFWSQHLLPDINLSRCARGFLFSYTALIAYQSDFDLAQEKGLLPKNLSWIGWKVLCREFLHNHDPAMVNPRYWYGELRLGRLNLIYRLRKGFVLRGYSKVAAHTIYVDLLRDNFAVLATVLGYVVIVLTSLQVGLGVDKLVEDTAFQNFSYGFTVFSIIAPLIAGVGILLAVLVMFVSNWIVTTKYEEQRFKDMGVEPYWRNKPGKAVMVPLVKPGEMESSSGTGV